MVVLALVVEVGVGEGGSVALVLLFCGCCGICCKCRLGRCKLGRCKLGGAGWEGWRCWETTWWELLVLKHQSVGAEWITELQEVAKMRNGKEVRFGVGDLGVGVTSQCSAVSWCWAVGCKRARMAREQ